MPWGQESLRLPALRWLDSSSCDFQKLCMTGRLHHPSLEMGPSPFCQLDCYDLLCPVAGFQPIWKLLLHAEWCPRPAVGGISKCISPFAAAYTWFGMMKVLIFSLKDLKDFTHLVKLSHIRDGWLFNYKMYCSPLPFSYPLTGSEIHRGWIWIQFTLGWILHCIRVSSKLSITLRDEDRESEMIGNVWSI